MTEFDQLTAYLDLCLTKNKINHEQYNHILCSFGDSTNNDYVNMMNQLHLKEGFISYQRELDNQEIELAYQNSMIDDFIHEAEHSKEQLNLKLNEFNIIMLQKKPDFENRMNRYNQFPDNPRLKSEYDKVREEYDLLQINILKLQGEIEDLDKKLIMWHDNRIKDN